MSPSEAQDRPQPSSYRAAIFSGSRVGAGAQVRVISNCAVDHGQYVVVDAQTFNYSQAAIWNDTAVAARYLVHWDSRWAQGMNVEMNY